MMPHSDEQLPVFRRIRKGARRGKPHMVSRAVASIDFGRLDLIIDGNMRILADAVIYCHPNSATQMVQVLQDIEDGLHQSISAHLMSACRHRHMQQIKIASVMSALGLIIPDAPQFSDEPDDPVYRHLHMLNILDSSSHGQMEKRLIEPDINALISRPWWHDFHGIHHGRFPGDMGIIQRLNAKTGSSLYFFISNVIPRIFGEK